MKNFRMTRAIERGGGFLPLVMTPALPLMLNPARAQFFR
jgi:hypothetical protein